MLARNKKFHYKMFVSCSELILLYRIFLILHISSFIQRLKFLFYFIFLPMECSWVRIIYFSFIGLNLETRKVSPREKHFKQFYTPLICLIDLSDSTTTHGINIKTNYWERYFLYFHNIILLALTINIYCNIILHINYHFSSSSAWLTNIWAASEANEGTLFRWNKDYSVKITSGLIHHIKSSLQVENTETTRTLTKLWSVQLQPPESFPNFNIYLYLLSIFLTSSLKLFSKFSNFSLTSCMNFTTF